MVVVLILILSNLLLFVNITIIISNNNKSSKGHIVIWIDINRVGSGYLGLANITSHSRWITTIYVRYLVEVNKINKYTIKIKKKLLDKMIKERLKLYWETGQGIKTL